MKNVVITGASKGLGYATALAFAERGHRVLALARNYGLLQKLQEQAANRKGELHINECDITRFGVNSVIEFFDSIDILIHNAGYIVQKPFAEITREELEAVYKANVFAPFEVTQKLMPYCSKRAHIINVSSVGGVTGTQKFPGLSAYSSSKAAMSCLSECWHAEFEDTEMTFNSLALGSVQTEMFEEAFPGMQAAASPEAMANYLVGFALEAPGVVRGKTLLASSSNP